MTQTDWNANTSAYKTQLDYDFSRYAKGVSTILSYSFYDRDPSKLPYQACTDRYYNNGDTRQWNLDIIYVVPSVKGLELKARYMDQSNDLVKPTANQFGTGTLTASQGLVNNDMSNRELRLEANYKF